MDQVLVMLTEVIPQWFKDGYLIRLAALGGVLLVLGAMRILAVRWSPAKSDPCSHVMPGTKEVLYGWFA